MRCAKAKKILSDYIDGNLSNQKRIQLEAHLRECSDCDADLARLRSLSAMLQEAGSVKVSEEYWNNYWQRLSVKLPPMIKVRLNWMQKLILMFRKPIPAVYALLAVLLVGLTVFFVDFYLDSRKTKSPELAKTVENSYYVAGAGREVTDAAKPQQLHKEGVEYKKNSTVTQQSERFDLELDEIVKSKEAASKRGRVTEEAETAQKKGVGLSEKLLDKRAQALGGAALASSTLGERYEPYGLIIRVLKVNPADAKLNINISKGIDSDSVFLSELRKANSKVNLESVLSSKIVTFVGKDISLAFKSGTREYNFQLNILPPSDQSQENRLAYLKNYSAPKPGETVMFDIPKEDSDENNFAVLVTRFEPQM